MMQARPTVESVIWREPTGESRAQLYVVPLALYAKLRNNKGLFCPQQEKGNSGPVWSNPEEMGLFYSERICLIL